jgi:cell division protein ZapD
VILYEYPFNERIRTYLRLEHLSNAWPNWCSAAPARPPLRHPDLFEIMDVGARADLKSDVLKDLDKQKQQLNSYRGNPAISEPRWTQSSPSWTPASPPWWTAPASTGQR